MDDMPIVRGFPVYAATWPPTSSLEYWSERALRLYFGPVFRELVKPTPKFNKIVSGGGQIVCPISRG